MPDSPAAPPAGSPGDDDNLIYFNGIDGETGAIRRPAADNRRDGEPRPGQSTGRAHDRRSRRDADARVWPSAGR